MRNAAAPILLPSSAAISMYSSTDARQPARATRPRTAGGMGTTPAPGQGEMTPAGASENLKLNILLRIEGDTMVNHSVPWSPAQNRVNQPSRSGPYLKKDGVIVAVKGPTFSADFTNDYDYGKSFPSKIHLEGTFNATRTAIEALEITFNAERTTPGVREARQWSLAAQGIPLSTPGTKRIEFVVRANNAKDRPKGFQILRADDVSTRRDETRTDKGDTQASEFKEDQLRLDNVAVTLDLTFRAQNRFHAPSSMPTRPPLLANLWSFRNTTYQKWVADAEIETADGNRRNQIGQG